jgi:HPt (histidine-containing phosphotransfer) domain-containing protein
MNPSPALHHPAADSARICRTPWTPHAGLLEAISGDDAVLAELIDAFKTDTETRILRICAALEIADVARLRSEAHSMNGSARQIGAEALAEVCRQLELASALTPLSHLSGQVLRIQELFGEVACAMTAYQAFQS